MEFERAGASPDLAGRFPEGDDGARAVLELCLRRIADREPVVHAMAHVAEIKALAFADGLDRSDVDRGPLKGAVAGIKDVIDTSDMPTSYGSAIYQGYQPAVDAACVRRLRENGANILSKTVTAEFAGADAVRTANPWDITRTPGGSSSGSAAAVADGMVHFALGTQTGGSTIRPAAFCGVVGFKPTFGLVDLTGVREFSRSLDTIGIMARDVNSVATISGTLAEQPSLAARPPDNLDVRFLICKTPFWDAASEDTVTAMDKAKRLLQDAGATVEELELSTAFASANNIHRVIMLREVSIALAHEHRTWPERIGPRMLGLLTEGARISDEEYGSALEAAASLRESFGRAVNETTIFITPAAVGEAPADRNTTGDAVFNSMWTLLHVPVINIPIGAGRSGMPVGIQLGAQFGRDDILLKVAAKFEELVARADGSATP